MKRRLVPKVESIHALFEEQQEKTRERREKISEAPKTHKNKSIIGFLNHRIVNQQTTILHQCPLHLSLFNFWRHSRHRRQTGILTEKKSNKMRVRKFVRKSGSELVVHRSFKDQDNLTRRESVGVKSEPVISRNERMV